MTEQSHSVLVGLQWGDEGKAKIIDYLGSEFDVVARFNGGANAGHTSRATINSKELEFVFHLLPSGALHEGTHCVLGNGMVVDPIALDEEVRNLEEYGIKIRTRLHISSQAHLVLPHHKERDRKQEERRKGNSLGTTLRGIGPAYEDKIRRVGFRMEDLIHPMEFEKSLLNLEEFQDNSELLKKYMDFAKEYGSHVTDISELLRASHEKGQKILFEGAQATFLDIDQGTYPYVSSSNSVAGGACTGCGVGPGLIRNVIGVAKSYLTRVGAGPFPTELTNEEASPENQELGNQLRERGREYGATTGRPRRTGWLDLVMLRRAVWVNGITTLALTKLDVLDHLPRIPVCVAYRLDGETSNRIPAVGRDMSKVEPVFEYLKGWECSTEGIHRFEDLPENARKYIQFLEEKVEVPINIISTSPHRDHTIMK